MNNRTIAQKISFSGNNDHRNLSQQLHDM